ncbi:MAG: hypothetical protein JW751_28705 [Polyangiaceae bacterium]|nr:hypothetical protein [Polyangiaceae bacterium]
MKWLGQRLVNLVVGCFALMGFCLVPLGEHTALGHLVALGRTDTARRLAVGLATAARAVAAELEEIAGAVRTLPDESQEARPNPSTSPRSRAMTRPAQVHLAPEAPVMGPDLYTEPEVPGLETHSSSDYPPLTPAVDPRSSVCELGPEG